MSRQVLGADLNCSESKSATAQPVPLSKDGTQAHRDPHRPFGPTGALGEQLEPATGNQDCCLAPLFPKPERKTNGGETNGPVDVDARLAAMKFGAESGAGVNATLPGVIAALIWRAEHPANIYARVFDALKQMAARDGLNWDWAKEEKQTIDRILAAYHNIFEKEYDPTTGVIPVWLPMEFHERWAAALAANRRPSINRNDAGWHIRSYSNPDCRHHELRYRPDPSHPEAAAGLQWRRHVA
jgi:hypothetical protein